MSWIREPNAEPIPGYRLIEPLGSGGFGEVWKCEAPGGLTKAIKIVYGNLNSLDVDCVRAEQERKALDRIKEVRHPFVCSLDRIEIVDGELCIVMELAERTLHDLFVECQAAGMIGVPRDNLLCFLRDAAEALDYMNDKHNLQHLDVKPRNLFVIGDRVKVADFGLVKHLERQTSSGLLGGVTPLYAAPETFLGKISHQSDQYSLAIVYQELLTGHRPFQGKNVRQMAQLHMKENPDLRSLPEGDRPIVARALAKEPDKRFPSCMAFISALYKSRSSVVRVEEAAQAKREAAVSGAALRPKSLADSMEDIHLSDSEVIDFAAPPPPIERPARRPPADDDEQEVEVSDMGVTVPQPDHGALRPTLIIGLGAFGRKAILELRCRFLDRFGDLSKLSLVRFLCIDSDPEAVNIAVRGAPQVALARSEFQPLPLQQVGNYRRRSLEHLNEWLPREKLYTMPRSLQTQGSRALGRLAFADNQQRLLARLRREIMEVTKPEAMYNSVTQTGLALRDNTPRVYVLAAAGGGGSGLLPDLGFGIRRLLAHMRHPDAMVHAFLLCGAPSDPATPKHELANVYATLTELNHYSDPTIPFAAQYGPDGQRIIDNGAPFTSVYMLPLAHRSPQALEESIAHLGNYLFHELTTPLGLRLDHVRHDDAPSESGPAPGQPAAPLRSFGTFAVWFPRGLLLHVAARQACKRLIEQWLAAGPTALSEPERSEIQAYVARVTKLPDFTPDAVAQRIEKATQAGTVTDHGSTPAEVLAGMLAKLEDQILQPLAQEDPANWAKQALVRIKDWLGTGETELDVGEWRKTRLTRALAAAAQKVVDEWDQYLAKDSYGMMEQPGSRVALAEASLEHLRVHCVHVSDILGGRLKDQEAKAQDAWNRLEFTLRECGGGSGGFRLFGARSKTRQLRVFMEHLTHFARHRLTDEVLGAVKNTFAGLSAKLADRARDLGFCRQRLRHLTENLDYNPADEIEELTGTRPGSDHTLTRSPVPTPDAFWDVIRQSATARVVLPDGEVDLERAALRFLQTLTPEQWQLLDKELNERVLNVRGGLQAACINSGDLIRQLAMPLLRETSVILGQHLPIMDVAQILGAELIGGAQQAPDELQAQTQDYLKRAAPLVHAKHGSKHAFLLVPASPAGRKLAETVHQAFPDIHHVRVPGQSDLMFLCEQGCAAADVNALLKPCRAAYEAAVSTPAASPHARFDVLDWLPLDP
ncbi:MAG: protein kinase [Gemmataceae bacterium]|nr:protein kinase [Gemmataceae bacterium]